MLVASFAYRDTIDKDEIQGINEGRHYPGHNDEIQTSVILHICPEIARMDRMHEIEEVYGLWGSGPDVPAGHRFLSIATFLQEGLRARL